MSKEAKIAALVVFGAWNFFGIISGVCDSSIGRQHGHSGCVYESLAAFTSAGYLVTCEIGRKRFSIEGIGPSREVKP